MAMRSVPGAVATGLERGLPPAILTTRATETLAQLRESGRIVLKLFAARVAKVFQEVDAAVVNHQV